MRQSLDWHELRRATDVGFQRRARAVKKGRKPAHGYQGGNEWDIDIEGAAAEMLVAKTLGVYWNPVVGELDTDEGDVAGVQVKWTKYETGKLHCPEPDDGFPYILVVGRAPFARIAGWAWGADLAEQPLTELSPGRHTRCLDQSRLQPIDRLIALRSKRAVA